MPVPAAAYAQSPEGISYSSLVINPNVTKLTSASSPQIIGYIYYYPTCFENASSTAQGLVKFCVDLQFVGSLTTVQRVLWIDGYQLTSNVFTQLTHLAFSSDNNQTPGTTFFSTANPEAKDDVASDKPVAHESLLHKIEHKLEHAVENVVGHLGGLHKHKHDDKHDEKKHDDENKPEEKHEEKTEEKKEEGTQIEDAVPVVHNQILKVNALPTLPLYYTENAGKRWYVGATTSYSFKLQNTTTGDMRTAVVAVNFNDDESGGGKFITIIRFYDPTGTTLLDVLRGVGSSTDITNLALNNGDTFTGTMP